MKTWPYAWTVSLEHTLVTSKDRCGFPLQRSVHSTDTEPNKMDTPPVEGEAEDNPMENWRGLAVPPKKRKSYLTPCPEWLHVDTAPKKQKMQIGLLPNCNLTKPVKIGKAQVSLQNTCAFDSFCQCLCSAFCDSENF